MPLGHQNWAVVQAAGAPFSDVAFVDGADAHALVFQAAGGFGAAPVEHVHSAAVAEGQVNGMDEAAPPVGEEAHGVAVSESARPGGWR